MTHSQTKDICAKIEQDRELIIELIQLCKQMSGHTKSLQNICLLAKPSQIFPDFIENYKDDFSLNFKAMRLTDFIDLAKTNETSTKFLFDELVNVVDEHKLQHYSPKPVLSKEVKANMDNLHIASKLAVLVRLLLKKQGIILPPVRFSISQEMMSAQIEGLIFSNIKLRKRIKTQLINLQNFLLQHLNQSSQNMGLTNLLKDASAQIAKALAITKQNHDLNSIIELLQKINITIIDLSPKHVSHKPTRIESKQTKVHSKRVQVSLLKKLLSWLLSGWPKKWNDI